MSNHVWGLITKNILGTASVTHELRMKRRLSHRVTHDIDFMMAAVAPHSEFWSGRCCALNMPPLSTLCVGLITKTYSTRRISHLGTPNEEPLQPLCNPPYQLHYRWGGTSFSVLEWEMWCLEYACMINPTHRGAYRSASLPNPTHFFKSLGYVFRPIGLSCVEFLSQFN